MKADSDQAQIQDCNQGLGRSRSPLLPISQREAVLEQRAAENNQRWKDSDQQSLEMMWTEWALRPETMTVQANSSTPTRITRICWLQTTDQRKLLEKQYSVQ